MDTPEQGSAVGRVTSAGDSPEFPGSFCPQTVFVARAIPLLLLLAAGASCEEFRVDRSTACGEWDFKVISVENSGAREWPMGESLGLRAAFPLREDSCFWRLKAQVRFNGGRRKEPIVFRQVLDAPPDSVMTSVIYGERFARTNLPGLKTAVSVLYNTSGLSHLSPMVASLVYTPGGTAQFLLPMELKRLDEQSKEYLPDFDLDYLFIAPRETTSISSMSIRLNDCPGIQVLPRVSPVNMKDHVAVLPALAGLTALTASAADVSGQWTAEVPGRQGQTQTMTFTFKVEGEKLTGSISTPAGESPISEGIVKGDELSFTQVLEFAGNQMKVLYKGKVSGDQIKFTRQREGGQGQAREVTAKRKTP